MTSRPKKKSVKRVRCDTFSPSIFPGDICVFLKPSQATNRDETVGRHVCIFVSSYVSTIAGLPSNRVIWVSIKDNCERTISSDTNVIEKECTKRSLSGVLTTTQGLTHRKGRGGARTRRSRYGRTRHG